jgi:putative hydrolase of HD superfamily
VALLTVDQEKEYLFMPDDRLLQQMQFLAEADKAKSIFRRNRILHGDRLENDAEHSWQLALMAIVLSEHADLKVDVLHVVKMLLVHDLVEIDAGDTFAFDLDAVQTQREREECAAERVFGLLPGDMAEELRALWKEFDALETPEAKFAASLDHLGGGVVPNCHHHGGCWREAGVSTERVKARNSLIAAGSPGLWEYAEDLIGKAQSEGSIS